MKKCCKSKTCPYNLKKSWDRQMTDWMFDHPLATTTIVAIPTFVMTIIFLVKNHII